jgi:hypothetical protein
MKMRIKKNINYFWLISLVWFVTIWVSGCATQADPLAGWKPDFSRETDQAIVNDYQSYIQNLPQKKEQFVVSVNWFVDGTGQHAIEIQMGVNRSIWRHVLIYDRENNRIKVIKYKTGGYRS